MTARHGTAIFTGTSYARYGGLFAREILEDLTAGITDGDVRPDIDIEGAVMALIAVLRGAGLHMIIRGAAPDTTASVRDTILISSSCNGPWSHDAPSRRPAAVIRDWQRERCDTGRR